MTTGGGRRLRALVALACVAAAAWTALPATAGTSSGGAAPVVAIVGEDPGVNVLHDDFRTADGRDPAYPPGMPAPVMVSLPTAGTFAERLAQLQAGPLGHPVAGRLYAVHGTRLLLYAAPGSGSLVGGDRLHATGVLSSAIGRRYGTAPTALGLFVPGTSPAAFDWFAKQQWVDVASMSSYAVHTVNSEEPATTPICLGAEPVSRWIGQGHVFFSSSGNTTDQPESVVTPNGLSRVYQVGGVDSTGHTWLPGHTEESDTFYAAGNVVRPYETGELFSFPAAAPDALTGSVHFGGTSGATPRTAGRAAALIATARAMAGSTGRRGPHLADATGHRRPAAGPLADGMFTSDELVDLLHAIAVPALPADGAGYAAEGYGALTDAAQRVGVRVLSGLQPMPTRTADDTANTVAEQARAALVDARCGVS
jgi:hypothetical protein